MFQNIIFRSFRPWLNKKSISLPNATQNEIPKWYKDADRYAVDKDTGEYIKAEKGMCPFPKPGTTDDYGKVPTWKACPAIMDSFSTGYVLKTPCDITFFKNNNTINVKITDDRYIDFCTKRSPMYQFEHPVGYYKDHFAWMPEWGIEVPEGYSCLYMTPMNRFDLPFLNTTGIVDNDKVHLSGTFPFFIVEGWEGTIKAGTTYMQILPFKREDWQHNIEFLNSSEIYDKMYQNMTKYRIPDGGVYQKSVWSRRRYR